MKPLHGLRVVDFSQFLAGPACSLRLADLGAEVIKIERPKTGDICRQLYVAKQKIGDESTIFHAINRNKKSLALDLKNQQDRLTLLGLIKSTDVVIQNFRPGVAERLNIDFESLKQLKPDLIYGSVSGYGKNKGPWFTKPGQDLLAQATSGLAWRNAPTESPMPMGLAIADLMAAYELTQGILALLVRRGNTGEGGIVDVSLLESLIALQSTELSAVLNTSLTENANELMVNGIYECADGFIAIAESQQKHLLKALGLGQKGDSRAVDSNEPDLNELDSNKLVSLLKKKNTRDWLECFSQYNIYAEALINWHDLRSSEHYKKLAFEQTIYDSQNRALHTTRCPIKIDGQAYYSDIGAPSVGQHNAVFENMASHRKNQIP